MQKLEGCTQYILKKVKLYFSHWLISLDGGWQQLKTTGYILISAKEVMFSPLSVCLFVGECLFLSRITQ